jgi:transposase-like protein
MKCPKCDSKNIKKNGHIHNGKQRYACGRQFVEFPENIIISDETKALIDKLLLERLALRAIVRITGVSLGCIAKVCQ